MAPCSAITASAQVAVPAEQAWAFVASGLKQTHWALGSLDRRELDNGMFEGTSRWDYSKLYIKIVSDKEKLLVDYFVGPKPDPNNVRWGVRTTVVPGTQLGIGENQCMVVMTTFRNSATTDEAWTFRRHCWETEIKLIKSRSEHNDILFVLFWKGPFCHKS